MEWKLYASLYRLELFEMKQYHFHQKAKYTYDESLQVRLQLLAEAEKHNITHIQLFLRQQIINHYWHNLKNYELAFEQYAIQKKLLEKTLIEEMPDKLIYLLRIGDAYFFFKDYRIAMSYYKEILTEKDNNFSQHSKSQARNSLGLCYRYFENDLERSDSCFLLIVKPENMLQGDERHRNVWSGISEGNLAINLMLREAYDQAIPLFKSSMEKTLNDGDWGFASNMAISLANVYLQQENIREAKHYIDLAKDYQTKGNREGMTARIYEALSKYYILTGNRKLSMVYMDSLLRENKRIEQQFNALQILRVEQKQHLSEQNLKEEQLHTEMIKSDFYKKSLIGIIVASMFFIALLVRYYLLYLKKKAAYQELIRK
jgi:tetratricopeptide (TPR) repeat protein